AGDGKGKGKGKGKVQEEASKRSAEGEADASEPKRQKTSGDSADVVPNLKEMRERIKVQKRAFDGSALEKAAPLLKWDYPTQLSMKATYVKTAVRSFTKHALKRCEKLSRQPPPWCLKEWWTAVKAPQGCCCPLDTPIGAPEESLRGWRNKCEFTIGHNEAGE
ncbi:unnamed protein product, partial [Polarella glacialis]